MEKISAVYKIVNTVTGDSYVGSSKDVNQRWTCHKCPSRWRDNPNVPLYKDFQKYGLDKFRFQILAPVMPEYLTQVEQEFIDLLHPTYNDRRSKGRDVEKRKEVQRKYHQSEKGKEANRKYSKTEKRKEVNRKYQDKLCEYNGETLTMHALVLRFRKAGFEHPNIEAKKYLIRNEGVGV